MHLDKNVHGTGVGEANPVTWYSCRHEDIECWISSWWFSLSQRRRKIAHRRYWIPQYHYCSNWIWLQKILGSLRWRKAHCKSCIITNLLKFDWHHATTLIKVMIWFNLVPSFHKQLSWRKPNSRELSWHFRVLKLSCNTFSNKCWRKCPDYLVKGRYKPMYLSPAMITISKIEHEIEISFRG